MVFMMRVEMEEIIERRINSELAKIEQENDVHVLLAVESGSRSWGFESPDSDWDVRFIYVHHPNWYLSIQEKRDVIEIPIDGDLDINGWDLRKALRLFKKSNPVFMEWIVSPYVYAKSGSFADKIRELAKTYYSHKAGAHHYLRMAQDNFSAYLNGKTEVRLKKYLYVLRPLVNIFWLMEKDGLIPMSFPETLRAVSVPVEPRKAIEKLLNVKKSIPEIGTGERIPIIDEFITDATEKAEEYCRIAPANKVSLEIIDEFFRSIIEESWSL